MKNPARKKSVQSGAFRRKHAVVHVSAIMHILLGYRGTYIWGGGGGYVLSGHCNRQQISGKNEGVLIFGWVLIYGSLRYSTIMLIVGEGLQRYWHLTCCPRRCFHVLSFIIHHLLIGCPPPPPLLSLSLSLSLCTQYTSTQILMIISIDTSFD